MNARMKCKICGNDVDNKIHVVKERILNKGDSFHYLECSKCGTWMMIDEINNLSQFYPDDYNPFKKNRLKPSILKKAYRYIMIRKIFNSNYSDYRKVASIRGIDALIKRCCGIRINKQSKILDIGCAKGEWLDDLYDVGYHNITGIDLFIPEEKMRNKRWRFIHGDIFSITDSSYDLITLNHSLEHMQQNPKDILLRVKELLNIGSYCMISIPLGGGQLTECSA